MRIKATQLRKGMIIEYNNDLYQLSEVLHITPGNWRAMIQTKMKSIRTGTNAEKRFRSDDIVVKANMETKEMEFLFQDGEMFTFMDIETFDQIGLHSDVVGEVPLYLLPNTRVLVNFYQGKPLSIDLPGSVELKVVETDPALKTATVTSSYKPAVLETGLKVQVPPFISAGEVIRIDTTDGTYLERVK
jgi:elongation factor P